MSMWFKNSGGKPDAMFTLAVVSWGVTTLLVVASLFQGEVKIGNASFTLVSPDVTLILGYFGACFTSYVVRRNKKDQLESDENKHMLENGVVE